MHASLALASCVLPRFNDPRPVKRIRSFSSLTPRSQPGSGLSFQDAPSIPSRSGRVVSAAGFKTPVLLLQRFWKSWCDLSAHGLASATRKPCLATRFPLTLSHAGQGGCQDFPHSPVSRVTRFLKRHRVPSGSGDGHTVSREKYLSPQILVAAKIFKAEICRSRRRYPEKKELCFVWKSRLRMERGFDAFVF
jgi:hypothetical protein